MASQTQFQSRLTARRSGLRKYQDFIIGRRGFLNLLKYEFVMMTSSWVPGALGVVLRKLFYPMLIGKTGRNVLFGRNTVLRHPHKMRIGNNVCIDDNCLLDAKGCGKTEFIIGNDTIISKGCILSAKYGSLHIGDNCNIGAGCMLYSGKSLIVGRSTMLAAQCYIGGSQYDPYANTDPIIEQPHYAKGVMIGEGCWLGAGAKVRDGVDIGEGTVIGMGAVVTRSIERLSVAMGVPARVKRKRYPRVIMEAVT